MSDTLNAEYKAYFARVVENWLKLDLWTPMEAVWLSFGLNPYDVTSGEESLPLEDIVGDNDVRNLSDQITTAIEAGKLKGKNGRVAPKDFIAWARKNSGFVPLPAELLAIEDKKAHEDKPTNAREENNLYRIVAALALTHYKLDPTKKDWVQDARRAARDLQAHGLTVKDEETILKQLKKAILEYPLQHPN